MYNVLKRFRFFLMSLFFTLSSLPAFLLAENPPSPIAVTDSGEDTDEDDEDDDDLLEEDVDEED